MVLRDRVAIITGGSKGIGAAIAMRLAKDGAKIAVVYVGDESAAQDTIRSISKDGAAAKAYKCDVSLYQDSKATVDNIIKDFGTVDILVNNAGITKDKLVLQMTESDWDSVVDINLKGAFNFIKHLYPHFVKNKRGSIVNISSVSGIDGNAGQASYSSSKAGMIGLTKSVAKELASRGITVNAVAPGFIDTDMTQVLSQSIVEQALQRIPMKALGRVEDVAELVAFLSSPQSKYITGQVIRVDGGLSL